MILENLYLFLLTLGGFAVLFSKQLFSLSGTAGITAERAGARKRAGSALGAAVFVFANAQPGGSTDSYQERGKENGWSYYNWYNYFNRSYHLHIDSLRQMHLCSSSGKCMDYRNSR